MENLYLSPSKKSVSRCWYCGLTIISLVLTLFLAPLTSTAQKTSDITGNILGIAPVISPANGTAIDGNAYANYHPDSVLYVTYPDGTPVEKEDSVGVQVVHYFGTSGDIFLWNDIDFGLCNGPWDGPGGGVLTVVGDTVYAIPPPGTEYTPGVDDDTVVVYVDDITNKDPTVFITSSKIDDDPNTYKWGEGSNPTKNEIQSAGALFSWGDPSLYGIDGKKGNPKDLWCAFAGDREDTDGSSYIDFEFLQAALWIDSIPEGSASGHFHSDGPDGGRTVDDYLISVEFQQGGADANVIVQRWTYDGLDSQGNPAYSYHVVPSDLVDTENGYPYGAILATVNTEKTYVTFPAFGQTETASITPYCSGVAQTPIEIPNMPYYNVNQWCEGAVNIGALFKLAEKPCYTISTVFIRTRSSGNGPSTLKDIPGPPIQLNITVGTTVAAIHTNVECYGTATGSITATADGEYPDYTYTLLSATNDSLDTKVSAGSVKFENLLAGGYRVAVIDAESCSSDTTDVITITQPPLLTVNAGSDIYVCYEDNEVDLTAAASGGTPGYSYEWFIDAGLSQSAGTGSQITVNPTSTMTYYVRATDQNNCTATDDVDVIVNPAISVDAGTDVYVCYEDNEVTLTATPSGGSGSYSYLWSTGATTASITVSPTSDTNYSVTVTDTGFSPTNGVACSATDDVDV
ncbi:Ig-like domain-containing protein, partial [Mangrovibacterium diazotrophicum]